MDQELPLRVRMVRLHRRVGAGSRSPATSRAFLKLYAAAVSELWSLQPNSPTSEVWKGIQPRARRGGSVVHAALK